MLISVVVAALVVFRLTRFLQEDDLIRDLREKFYLKNPYIGLWTKTKPSYEHTEVFTDTGVRYVSEAESFKGRLASCLWCLSIYVTVPVSLLMLAAGSLAPVGLTFIGWLIYTAAVWASACILLRTFSF